MNLLEKRKIAIVAIILVTLFTIIFFLVIIFPSSQSMLLPTGTRTAPRQQIAQLPTPTPLEFTEIIISLQALPRGFRIPANAVDLRPWPLVSAPASSITSLENVIGKIARTDIFREQPILMSMVVDDPTSLASIGSDLAALIPPGMVTVTLSVTSDDVSQGIQFGDRVDLIYSFEFLSVDEEFQSQQPNIVTLIRPGEDGEFELQGEAPGRIEQLPPLGEIFSSPREAQRPRLAAQRLIQDALVMFVGEIPQTGQMLSALPTPTVLNDSAAIVPTPNMTSNPILITLAVTQQDAIAIIWAKRANLPVFVSLRAAADTNRNITDSVTLDYLMDNYNVPLPARNPYVLGSTNRNEDR